MPVEIVPVRLEEKSDLWAMFQLYASELAPMVGVECVNGEFPFEPFDDYWREESYWPFWGLNDGERIGFALVRREPDNMRVAEFFIAPECRRDGLGSDFARGFLARYHGPWRIRQVAVNTKAVAFWRRIAEPFGYTEIEFVDKGLGRVEQSFTVR